MSVLLFREYFGFSCICVQLIAQSYHLKLFEIFVSLLYSLDMNFIDNFVVSHKIKHALNNFYGQNYRVWDI